MNGHEDSTNAIEMSRSTRKGHTAVSTNDDDDDDEDKDKEMDDFDDEDAVMEVREPFAWVDKQVRRQNRCAIVALVAMCLAAAVYVVGGVYMTDEQALEGDKYEAESGILSENFEGDKAQDNYEKKKDGKGHNWWNKHGKDNPFGNENAVEHGNSDGIDRGNPYPGNAGGGLGNMGNKDKNGGIRGKDTTNNSQVELPHDAGAGHGHDTGKPSDGSARPKGGNAGHSNSGPPRSTLCDHSGYQDWLDATVTPADGIKYEIIEKFQHDHQAFVQGLTYANGTLWESNGLYGHSTVRILDPDTANVIKSVDMPATLFGEGMAYAHGKLYQITWKSQQGFVYNATTLDVIEQFEFHTTRGEGWGITWDPCQKEFIVTDGSEFLHFWDKDTLAQSRKIPVRRRNGDPIRGLNEIEWYRGKVLANVWYQDVLLVIDPATGIIEKEYDFSALFPKLERDQLQCDVFNGISVSEDPEILYVTGKMWDRMFKIRLLT